MPTEGGAAPVPTPEPEQGRRDAPTVTPANRKRREPATYYGQKMMQGRPPYENPYPQGPLQAFGRAFSSTTEDVAHRWRSLEPGDSVTKEEFDEIVGDAPVSVDWGPSMTRERAQFLADEARREQWSQQFESRPVAEFLGASLPTVADPVSVATMPVGGTSFAAASRATTLGQFLKHSTAGGAKVGAATAPIEAAAQPSFYGEMRPEMLAGAVAGPVLASPLLGLPGFALKSVAGRRTGIQDTEAAQDMAEAAATSGQMDADIADMTSRLTDEEGDLPAPPMGQRPPEEAGQRPRELDRLFGDWTGQERGWVRDLAAGDEAAAARAREVGIDPDSPALQRFLEREGERTLRRSRQVDEDRFTELRDFSDFVAGRASPEQQQRLAAAGMVESAETARVARQTPEDWRLGEVLRASREADAADAQVRELAAAPGMRPLQEALETPAARRTSEQQELTRAFMENGAGAAKATYLERRKRDYEQALDREADIEERIAEGLEQYRELDEARAARRAAYEDLEAARAEARTEQDGEFDIDEFVQALEAARMESAAQAPGPEPRQYRDSDEAASVASNAMRPGDDPETADLREFAQRNGVDTDEIDREVDAYVARMMECWNG